jgi:glycerophosphoryl diester phosphodiesterase
MGSISSTSIILTWLLLLGCSSFQKRGPATTAECQENGVGCPFLNIAHRGAPFEFAENTIPAYEEALKQGANALEIDLVMTKENEVVLYHDRDPNDLISLIRQAGLEGQKYVPYLPNLGSAWRVPTEQLTLEELREFYGFALRRGGLADALTPNRRDSDVVIPTLSEFAVWANTQEKLEAVLLDIKLIPGQEGLAVVMAEKFAEAFKDSRWRPYMLTQYPSIYIALQEWVNQHPEAKNHIITLDNEQAGSLNKRSAIMARTNQKVKSLALGATIFRRWRSYKKELAEVLDRSRRRDDSIYPVVSWTVDNERKLYELLQMGVDGILTNRPDRLNRLVHRHWKDHSLTARALSQCHEAAKRGMYWMICATGSSLDPLVPISYEDARNWVCGEKQLHSTLRDYFGCSGVGDRRNITYKGKIDNSSSLLVFSAPSGTVELTSLSRSPTNNDQLAFLNFRQEKCNDGVLNHKCEYELEVQYLQQGTWKSGLAKTQKKDSFHQALIYPKSAEHIKVFIRETDDGRVSDEQVIHLFGRNEESVRFRSPGRVFSGEISLSPREITPWPRGDGQLKEWALEYTQERCNDGAFNYKCEYKIKVEVMLEDNSLKEMDGSAESVMKDSFVMYAQVPKRAKGLKITLMEMDGSVIAAQGQFFSEILHGLRMEVDSGEGTFRGQFIIKELDFNEAIHSTEGDSDARPHEQRLRQEHNFLRLNTVP